MGAAPGLQRGGGGARPRGKGRPAHRFGGGVCFPAPTGAHIQGEPKGGHDLEEPLCTRGQEARFSWINHTEDPRSRLVSGCDSSRPRVLGWVSVFVLN